MTTVSVRYIVNDVDEAAEFYAQNLGFQLEMHPNPAFAMLSLGEMVPPEEVAALIVFLAGGECRHLTGATIDVNGATYIR